MADLVIEGLTKTFGKDGAVAVDNVNITLPSGKWLTLLGPSGCGKSTTLNCIAGLEVPASGRIRLGDQLLFDGGDRSLPPEKRDVGMVFQSYALWPHLTVEGNIGFPLELRGVPAKERAARIREIADLVELGTMLKRYPHQLSGGQQQRVALARALVYKPKILLLDEPLSNLDAKLRERARAWLTNLQRQLAVTTVYVTHDQTEALTMSDEIVVMNQGKIAQRGTPEEIYSAPASLFVADFIGTSNLIDGRVVSRSGSQGRVAIADTELDFNLPDGVRPEERVLIAARPESIHFEPAGSPSAVRARVLQKTYMGFKYEYLVEVEGREIKVESPVSLDNNGGDVFLRIEPQHCTVFPHTA